METTTNSVNERHQILLDNQEVEPPERNEEKEKIRTMVITGVLSIAFLAIILITLPFTILTFSGLVVYASIVALMLFLFQLLFRYFSIMILAYLYITKYTVEEPEPYFPFISIIMPVYNEGVVLKDSVESIVNLDYPNYEIIIVNDGSTDNTLEIAEPLVGYKQGLNSLVKVSLINKPNGGKSKALNAGIQYSEAEFVLCVDGDSQLSAESLRMGIRHFVNPAIGAVAGYVKVLNRKKLLSDLQALEYIEGLNLARSAQGFLKMVNIIPGPIGFFRKRALHDAGYYSSDTFAEDADLTLKVLAKGWKIGYEPAAISYTEAPIKLHQLLKQRYRWTRGILQAIRKHKKHIVNPTLNFNNTIILWSMAFEALIWPVMNIFGNLFFIFVGIFYGLTSLISFWWMGITILDIMAALYCIAVEKEEVRLIPYSLVYRLVFILIIDVTKFMATIEEFLGIEMNWGKLERLGLGQPVKK
ncbi:MAG: glycosyltransferase family 2 protein [bacterium]